MCDAYGDARTLFRVDFTRIYPPQRVSFALFVFPKREDFLHMQPTHTHTHTALHQFPKGVYIYAASIPSWPDLSSHERAIIASAAGSAARILFSQQLGILYIYLHQIRLCIYRVYKSHPTLSIYYVVYPAALAHSRTRALKSVAAMRRRVPGKAKPCIIASDWLSLYKHSKNPLTRTPNPCRATAPSALSRSRSPRSHPTRVHPSIESIYIYVYIFVARFGIMVSVFVLGVCIL